MPFTHHICVVLGLWLAILSKQPTAFRSLQWKTCFQEFSIINLEEIDLGEHELINAQHCERIAKVIEKPKRKKKKKKIHLGYMVIEIMMSGSSLMRFL